MRDMGQHAMGINAQSRHPSVITDGIPPFIPPQPDLAFDTYISNGVLGAVVSTATATDLNPGAAKQFDQNGISIGWYTSATDDIGSLALARITLSDNATGSFEFRTTAMPAGGTPMTASGTIFGGTMLVS